MIGPECHNRPAASVGLTLGGSISVLGLKGWVAIGKETDSRIGD